MIDWINRMGKWRTVLVGWQLGTRSKADPEAAALRDHREVSLMLRAEGNAIAALLVQKGIFTADEFTTQVNEECRLMCEALEKRFPGFKAADDGMLVNTAIARDTTAGWKP